MFFETYCFFCQIRCTQSFFEQLKICKARFGKRLNLSVSRFEKLGCGSIFGPNSSKWGFEEHTITYSKKLTTLYIGLKGFKWKAFEQRR